MHIPGRYLKALLCFTAKKDPRPYLNGVNFEIIQGKLILVATNGHILCAIRADIDCEMIDGNYIVGNDLLSKVSHKCDVLITFTNKSVVVEQNGVAMTGALIEGRYPSWRQVIPDELSGVISTFTAETLVAVHKAREILNPSKNGYIDILHNGDDCSIINMGMENVITLIAPVKTFPKSYNRPTWI